MDNCEKRYAEMKKLLTASPIIWHVVEVLKNNNLWITFSIKLEFKSLSLRNDCHTLLLNTLKDDKNLSIFKYDPYSNKVSSLLKMNDNNVDLIITDNIISNHDILLKDAENIDEVKPNESVGIASVQYDNPVNTYIIELKSRDICKAVLSDLTMIGMMMNSDITLFMNKNDSAVSTCMQLLPIINVGNDFNETEFNIKANYLKSSKHYTTCKKVTKSF